MKKIKKKTLKADLSTIAIVAVTNPMGFTYNLNEDKMQATGYAVALSATQNSCGADGFLKVVEYARKDNIECIGGWLENETDCFYFDATVIVNDKEQAIALGKANGQSPFLTSIPVTKSAFNFKS